MAKRAKAIPDGYHTVTPYLTVRGADQAITFYKNAFGAEELMRMPEPDGKGIMHAEIKIGDSRIFLSEEFPETGCRSPESLGGSASSLHLYVEDVDAAFKRAVSAGAQVKMPVADMCWGNRFSKLIDAFGHEWGMATHTEDRTSEEICERANAFFAQMVKSQLS